MIPFLPLVVRRQATKQHYCYHRQLSTVIGYSKFHSNNNASGIFFPAKLPCSTRHTLPLQQLNQAAIARFFSTASSSSSTTTTTSSHSSLHDPVDIQKYLNTETFPIGSLDAHAREEIITWITTLSSTTTTKGSAAATIPPDSIGLTFQLLDRLFQEAQRGQQQQQTAATNNVEFSFPTSLVLDVIQTWKTTSTATLAQKSPPSTVIIMSPSLPTTQQVFETLVQWETMSSEFRPLFAPCYSVLIDVAATSNDPNLAEEILHHLLLLDTTTAKASDFVCPGVATFNRVLDAWAKSGKDDSALRAQAVLTKMMSLEESGWQEAAPNVVSFNSAMLACGKLHHKDQNLQHAMDLFAQMRRRGLLPDQESCSIMLTIQARSRQPPDLALEFLRLLSEWHAQGTVNAKPNAHCYAIVMAAFARHGHVRHIKLIFSELLDRFKSTGDWDYLPNHVCFNDVISACSQTPQMAEAVLIRWQDVVESLVEPSSPLYYPNTASFNLVLQAYANSSVNRNNHDAPLRCEPLLLRMQNLFQKGIADCEPNGSSLHSVLECWARSDSKDAPLKAETILRYMIQLHEKSGNQLVEPSIASYNAVIYAWTKSPLPNPIDRAQALFDEVMHKSIKAGYQRLKPDPTTFRVMIAAWARNSKHRKDGALKAQAVLDQMTSRMKNGDMALAPQAIDYNALINAWAKAGEPERAEMILRGMNAKSLDAAKPNIISYASVINAWAISGRQEAGERASALLDEIMQNYKAGTGVKPDLHVFASTMSAWGRSRSADCGEKAQAAFDSMLELRRDGDERLKPNSVVLIALIDAWTKAGNPEKAEKILRQMESFGTKPTVMCYASVMNAWSMSESKNSTTRVTELFEELIQKYKAGENELKPNVVVFSILITALGQSKSKDGAVKAQAIFDAMIAGYKSGNEDLRPNSHVFHALIDAWGRAGEPERSESIFLDMSSFGVRPNILTFRAAMNAWIHSGRPDAEERAHALYNKMLQEYRKGDNSLKPDGGIYRLVISTWCKSERPDALSKANEVFNEMLNHYRSGDTALKSDVDKLDALITKKKGFGIRNKDYSVRR